MRLVFFTIASLLALNVYCQSGEELDNRNGFKDIKLLTDVRSYAGLSYSKPLKGEEFCDIYTAKKGDYSQIGDVKIYGVKVLAYKDMIYQIELTTEKNEQLYRSLEKAFGKINSSIAIQNSYWEGEKVRLNYQINGTKKIKLVYISKEINQIIAQDKLKAIDSLSSEF